MDVGSKNGQGYRSGIGFFVIGFLVFVSILDGFVPMIAMIVVVVCIVSI